MDLNCIWILFKKEIKSYFTQPTIYLLSALFIFIMGWIFFNSLVISKKTQLLTLTNAVIRPIFGNMGFIFLIVIPLITMKSFAEENREKTIELLLTSKLSLVEIILGKFLSSTLIVIFITTLTLIFPLILYTVGYSDWNIIFMSYVGTIINSMAFIAIGLFISSICENQIISAVATFFILLFNILLAQSSAIMNNFLISQIIQYFSIVTHFVPFTFGVLRSYNLIYYASFIIFFLILTHYSLKLKRI